MNQDELPLPLEPASSPLPAPSLRQPVPVPVPPRPRRLAPGLLLAALRAWLIDQIFLPAFHPRRSTEPVWKWGDAAGLPVEGGGKFSSRKKPHCRTFIAKSADPSIREQHVMKASRAGYTQGALVRLAHKAVHDPGNVQFTAGAKKDSTEVNKSRIIPMLERIGVIGRPDDDPDDATSSIIRLARMVVRITGSFTATAFRTHMVELAINDDCEVVTDIPGIGSPADGARSRIRGREGAQLLSISRANDYASPHHIDVATGTLEYYAVPCPHCGTFQELTIDGRSLVDQLRIEDPLRDGAPPVNRPLGMHMALTAADGSTHTIFSAAPKYRLGGLDFHNCKLLDGSWDFNRILSETRYRCVSGCMIDESAPLTAADLANPLAGPSFSAEVHQLHANGYHLTHKQAMMLSGRHLPANPDPVPADGGGPRSKRSEHNSDLVSLDFDMTWGHLAKKFAERAHDPASLRNFFNEHAGLPFRDRNTQITDQDILNCREPYERCTLPFYPDFFTLCADTQDAWWKWVVCAGRLDSSGQAWSDIAVINWGGAMMKTDLIDELTGYLVPETNQRRPYRLASNPSKEFLPTSGLVDLGGHRTDEVYELHYLSMVNGVPRFYPSKGADDKSLQLRPTWQRQISEAWRGCTFDICWYWDDHWQRKLVSSIRQVLDIKHCTEKEKLDPSAKGLPTRLWLPGIPADMRLREFEKELLNEALIEGKWTKLGVQDFRDALKECFASFDLALPVAVEARKKRIAAEKAAASS
jgi:hypothetical protein